MTNDDLEATHRDIVKELRQLGREPFSLPDELRELRRRVADYPEELRQVLETRQTSARRFVTDPRRSQAPPGV